MQDSRDSSVGITKDYELDGRGLIPDMGKKLFSSPFHQNWIWGSLQD
jgi:hypothetical protein